MKNVLVLIHDDKGQEARLQAALDATRALKGHLNCLDVSPIVPFIGDMTGVSGGAVLIELERETETANAARMRQRLAGEDVQWSLKLVTGYFEQALELEATLADLIVVNRACDVLPLPDLRGLAASLVMQSGRPILAVPEETRGFNAAGAAVVAWNGSHEAASALAAAVPLLALASSVTIVEIDETDIVVPAEEAAAYLSRHGIHAQIMRWPDGRVAEGLIALAHASDWLVMGAFGHSRLHEALCGGVTRRLLKESPIPLLLAH
ncbi:universal stress protein [Allosphingosinicella sp.]|uniref:universal stress protein n=1 Tax=Allosphingosinicella sp. TaxID=2823234 RepID=UPI0037836BE0